MWELNYIESWAPKNWCFWTVVLEKTLESPLDCKEIHPVHPTGNQSWIFVGKADAEAQVPILWPPDAKSWLIGKDPDAGKDWQREEKVKTEDEMVGCHHQRTWVWANSRSWWRTWRPGVLQSMDTTEQLNWTSSLRQWMFLTLLGFWELGSGSGFVGWLWIKSLFSHLKADDSGESASRFHLVVTSVCPQLSARDCGASLMGHSQQGSWCPPERGRERAYRTESAASTHQTSTIGRAHQPVYKAGAARCGSTEQGQVSGATLEGGYTRSFY